MDKYLRERGDANIKTNADLITKARFYNDPNFPDRKQAREAAERATTLDTSARLQTRFAIRTCCCSACRSRSSMRCVADVDGPPRKLTCAARAERERPASDRLVAYRAAGISGDYGARGIHDAGLGSRAGWERDAAGRAGGGGAASGGRLPRASV